MECVTSTCPYESTVLFRNILLFDEVGAGPVHERKLLAYDHEGEVQGQRDGGVEDEGGDEAFHAGVFLACLLVRVGRFLTREEVWETKEWHRGHFEGVFCE